MKSNQQAPFWVKIQYVLRQVWAELIKKKYGTLLTILVIAVSLTIPTISFLLWKNTHQAMNKFYPNTEITAYLHNNLSENDAAVIVAKIREIQGVESLNYISRQQSLKDFRSWSGFAAELDILEDNPLPAVIMIKATTEFQSVEKRQQLQQNLSKIKGVEQVNMDNDWLEKLTALTWLIAHIAIFCAILMVLAVFLVIGNSIRSDVYSSKANIEVMKLLGATDQFILRPFLYTGVIYGLLGAIFASLFSGLLITYFKSAVNYVADIFAVTFELNSLALTEIIFLLSVCAMIGYFAAWIAATKHIKMLEK